MIFQVICAFVAVMFTCVILEGPKKMTIPTAIAGALGWYVYLLFLNEDGAVLSTYISSLLIAFLSHILARIYKSPATVIFIPAFFPLVPGAAMYRTVYYFLVGDNYQCRYYLMSAMMTAGMIALAIFTVDSAFRIYFTIKAKIAGRND